MTAMVTPPSPSSALPSWSLALPTFGLLGSELELMLGPLRSGPRLLQLLVGRLKLNERGIHRN